MYHLKKTRVERTLYQIGLCLPCIGIPLWWIALRLMPGIRKLFLIPCQFHALTGLYCPGCGGTRAVLCLLHGNLAAAFFYHPVVPYFFAIYLWFMASHTADLLFFHRRKIGMRYQNGYLWGALFLVILNLAVKNIALTAFGIDTLKQLDLIYF